MFYQDMRQVKTVGYCLMPNHIHWLFHIQDKKIDAIWVLRTFKSFIATQAIIYLKKREHMETEPLHTIFQNNTNIKSDSARNLLNYFAECAKLAPGQNHRFWQRNSDLKFIPNYDMLRQKLDYIHYNPLQSHWELVTEAFSYPFSSCKYYDSGEDSQGLEILNLL